METDHTIQLRDDFNNLPKERPIKILFGYVEGSASNNHRYDHWVNFQTTRMAQNGKIKVKNFYSPTEKSVTPVSDKITISREDCKIIVYVTICPESGATFKSESNLGK